MDVPLAYFLTWTIYGTHLQGDADGWRHRSDGPSRPQPRLSAWHAKRLKRPVLLLSDADRAAVKSMIEKHAAFRNWQLWTTNPRSTHVHVVVSAPFHTGQIVRDQLKANCTGELRKLDNRFVDRPVWTRGGDVEFIDSEQDLETVIAYVNEAQDLKHLQ